MATSGMIYGSSTSRIQYGYAEGYAVFHNTATGSLPSTMQLLLPFYRNMTLCLLILLAGWHMVCRQRFNKIPTMITESNTLIWRAIQLWLFDAASRWLALKILNTKQTDFRSFKDMNSGTINSLLIRFSLIVLVSSCALRDGLSFFWLSKFAFNYGSQKSVLLTTTVLEFIWGLYAITRVVFSLGILLTFRNFSREWLFMGSFIFFIQPVAVAIPADTLLRSYLNGAKRNQPYKSGIFFSLGWPALVQCSFGVVFLSLFASTLNGTPNSLPPWESYWNYANFAPDYFGMAGTYTSLTSSVLLYYMYILRPTKYSIQRILNDEAVGIEGTHNDDIEINAIDETRTEESGTTMAEPSPVLADQAHPKEGPPPYTGHPSEDFSRREPHSEPLQDSNAPHKNVSSYHDEREPLFRSP